MKQRISKVLGTVNPTKVETFKMVRTFGKWYTRI